MWLDNINKTVIISVVVAIALSLMTFTIWRIWKDDQEAEEMSINFPGVDQIETKSLLEKQEKRYLSGKTDKYEWSQQDEDIEIRIPVNDNTKTKDVQVIIKSNLIQLKILGEDYLNGSFYDEVLPSDCTWQFDNVDNSRILEITIRKKHISKDTPYWQYPLKDIPKEASY
jgi:hypothetical protein